jgi:hypothetical protein
MGPKCLPAAAGDCHDVALEGTERVAPVNARPYRTRSWAGNQIEPERDCPSVRACKRWPGPTVMISPVRILIPPQIGAGRSPIGSET